MNMQKRVINQTSLQHYRRTPIFLEVPTVDEWLVYWLEHYIKPTSKPNTYSNFNSYIFLHLLPMLGDYRLNELKIIELQYYIDHKLEKGRRDNKGGLSIKTVKEHLSMLNNAYKKAISLQIVQYNPTQGVEFPKQNIAEIKVFEIKEQKKIISSIPTNYKKNSLIPILLGVYGGLRIGEISALKIDDIDFERKQIRVDESLNRVAKFYPNNVVKYQLLYGSTKSNKTRYIPMNDDLFNALSNYYSTMPQDVKITKENPLFLNSHNGLMEPRNINYHFTRLMNELNITGYHFHCLRHTFATRALELNIDIKSCSQILGHSTTKITLDRYTHVTMNHLHNEIKKLNKKNIQKLQP